MTFNKKHRLNTTHYITTGLIALAMFAMPAKASDNLAVIQTNETIRYSDRDLNCLAKNIYHEAGSESKLGKYAVAQVTLNRSRSKHFPAGICAVVHDPNQFSWVRNKKAQPKGTNWSESKQVARAVLEDGKRVDGLDTALFFHEARVRPRWTRIQKRITQIGAHVFYGMRRP